MSNVVSEERSVSGSFSRAVRNDSNSSVVLETGDDGRYDEVDRLIHQIGALLQDHDPEEDGRPPTAYAIWRFLALLFGAAPALFRDQEEACGRVGLPHGFACAREDGGLSVEWRDPSHFLVVSVGPDANPDTSSLYFFNDGAEGREPVSAENLSRRLLMFPVV